MRYFNDVCPDKNGSYQRCDTLLRVTQYIC
jgi:hypothetical protein